MLKFNGIKDDRPIWPRNPWPDIPRPLSNPYFEQRSDLPSHNAPPTQWSPYGMLQAVPYMKGNRSIGPDPRTPDARTRVAARNTDFYDSSPNAWPNNGQWDRPNGYFAQFIRLRTHTSAHPGLTLKTGGGPTMYFKAPPVFSMQTKPIPAVGIYMAKTTTKTKTTTKKGKGGLTKKYGPLPLWVYLGVVGIVILYLYFRHKHSQSGQTVTSPTGGYVQPQPSNGVDVVPSGNANTSTGDTGTSSSQPIAFPTDYATQTDLQNAIDNIDSQTAAAIAGITFPQPSINITIPRDTVAKKTASSKTAAKIAHPGQPFGGVVGTKKLKNGSILTTYRSGRVVERAPGKSAYVVHK